MNTSVVVKKIIRLTVKVVVMLSVIVAFCLLAAWDLMVSLEEEVKYLEYTLASQRSLFRRLLHRTGLRVVPAPAPAPAPLPYPWGNVPLLSRFLAAQRRLQQLQEFKSQPLLSQPAITALSVVAVVVVALVGCWALRRRRRRARAWANYFAALKLYQQTCAHEEEPKEPIHKLLADIIRHTEA